MKTLIIDNYDSFTYILKQYFGELGGNPEVFFNDEITVSQIEKMKPTHIVLSPGPGTVDEPKDVGIMFEIIKKFYKKVPILGVCLGHQAIGKIFEGKIVRAPKIMHGKRSDVFHKDTGHRKQKTAKTESLFKGIKNPMEVMRYHSLVIDTPFWMNEDIDTIAHTSDFSIMGIKHKCYPLYGVQFHPESLGTKDGKQMLSNFLKL